MWKRLQGADRCLRTRARLTCRRELHERLLLRNEQTKQVRLPEIYVENEITKANVQTWMNAQFLQDAVDNIQTVSSDCLFDVSDRADSRRSRNVV